jgi:hypothetical protein
MNGTTFYRVSWTRIGAHPESKDFPEWDAAVAFYEDVLDDHRTLQAKIIEVTEKEVRCTEHEGLRGP